MGCILMSSLTCCIGYRHILLDHSPFAEEFKQWNASLSQVELKWTEEQFNSLFGRKLFDRITADDLERATREYQLTMNDDPKKRTFDRCAY